MAIEIKNRWTDAVIYTREAEGATMRDAVLAARVTRADLSDANLSGANLSDANLSGAYLRARMVAGMARHDDRRVRANSSLTTLAARR